MNIFKSILAVLAGLIFIFVTHNGSDFLLESFGIFTPATKRFDTIWMVIMATLYRAVLSIIGCYIVAVLAPSRPMLHAMILGAIGVYSAPSEQSFLFHLISVQYGIRSLLL